MHVSEWAIDIYVVVTIAIVCAVIGYFAAAVLCGKRFDRVAKQLDISRNERADVAAELVTARTQLRNAETCCNELKIEGATLQEQLQLAADAKRRLLIELNERKAELGSVQRQLTQVRERQHDAEKNQAAAQAESRTQKDLIDELRTQLLEKKQILGVREKSIIGIQEQLQLDIDSKFRLLVELDERKPEIVMEPVLLQPNDDDTNRKQPKLKWGAEDYASVVQLAKKAKLGDAYAKVQYDQTLERLHRFAMQGDADSQFNLGLIFKNALGVELNNVKAIKLFKKAAIQEHAGAQYEVGKYYLQRDYIKALHWYKKAAEQEYPDAQYYLGLMYAKGHGVPQDLSVSFEWYKKAASKGNSDAQLKIGLMYWYGKVLQKDKAHAVSWFCKSAGQGNGIAINRLRDAAKEGNNIAVTWLMENRSEKYSDRYSSEQECMESNPVCYDEYYDYKEECMEYDPGCHDEYYDYKEESMARAGFTNYHYDEESMNIDDYE